MLNIKVDCNVLSFKLLGMNEVDDLYATVGEALKQWCRDNNMSHDDVSIEIKKVSHG